MIYICFGDVASIVPDTHGEIPCSYPPDEYANKEGYINMTEGTKPYSWLLGILALQMFGVDIEPCTWQSVKRLNDHMYTKIINIKEIPLFLKHCLLTTNRISFEKIYGILLKNEKKI